MSDTSELFPTGDPPLGQVSLLISRARRTVVRVKESRSERIARERKQQESALQHALLFDGSGAFFYPQRLKMACGLSLWICLMFCLIGINFGNWVVAFIGQEMRQTCTPASPTLPDTNACRVLNQHCDGQVAARILSTLFASSAISTSGLTIQRR